MAEAYSSLIVGGDQIVRLLLRAGAGVGPALARGLYEEGQLAFRDSQKQVPYRWGILKGSGNLSEPAVSGTNVDIEITYGGGAMKYAMAVHELDKNYRSGKKRYYLLDPVQARIPNMDRRLGRRIERIMGGD